MSAATSSSNLTPAVRKSAVSETTTNSQHLNHDAALTSRLQQASTTLPSATESEDDVRITIEYTGSSASALTFKDLCSPAIMQRLSNRHPWYNRLSRNDSAQTNSAHQS